MVAARGLRQSRLGAEAVTFLPRLRVMRLQLQYCTSGRLSVTSRRNRPAVLAGRMAGHMLLLAALVGGGCRKAAPAAPPPPQVSVLTVQPASVAASYEYTGQAEASKRVEVRAQVSGVIVHRPYVEGTDVKKGAVLFRIDPTPYEAAYRSAQAQLTNVRVRLGNAERNLSRLTPLLGDHAVAQKDVDDA